MGYLKTRFFLFFAVVRCESYFEVLMYIIKKEWPYNLPLIADLKKIYSFKFCYNRIQMHISNVVFFLMFVDFHLLRPVLPVYAYDGQGWPD